MLVEHDCRQVHREFYGCGVPVKRRIAFVLSDFCDLLGVEVVAESLQHASELSALADQTVYPMQFLSARGGTLMSAQSLVVSTETLNEAMETRFSFVLVAAGPSALDICNILPQATWLQLMRALGTPVRFLSTGSEPHQHTVATARRSDIDRIRQQALNSEPRGRLASAIHAAFEIISADLDESIAQEALRRTTVARADHTIMHSIDVSLASADRIRSTARWLKDNCHRPICVADAASFCAMSERTLLRYFQAYYGTSPSGYLQRVRLDLACELLAETSLPADKIARHVGLTNGARLGKLLRRCLGKSPSELRAIAVRSIR
jgi:transcriptional regulator GlxA family with amidase domain